MISVFKRSTSSTCSVFDTTLASCSSRACSFSSLSPASTCDSAAACVSLSNLISYSFLVCTTVWHSEFRFSLTSLSCLCSSFKCSNLSCKFLCFVNNSFPFLVKNAMRSFRRLFSLLTKSLLGESVFPLFGISSLLLCDRSCNSRKATETSSCLSTSSIFFRFKDSFSLRKELSMFASMFAASRESRSSTMVCLWRAFSVLRAFISESNLPLIDKSTGTVSAVASVFLSLSMVSCNFNSFSFCRWLLSNKRLYCSSICTFAISCSFKTFSKELFFFFKEKTSWPFCSARILYRSTSSCNAFFSSSRWSPTSPALFNVVSASASDSSNCCFNSRACFWSCLYFSTTSLNFLSSLPRSFFSDCNSSCSFCVASLAVLCSDKSFMPKRSSSPSPFFLLCAQWCFNVSSSTNSSASTETPTTPLMKSAKIPHWCSKCFSLLDKLTYLACICLFCDRERRSRSSSSSLDAPLIPEDGVAVDCPPPPSEPPPSFVLWVGVVAAVAKVCAVCAASLALLARSRNILVDDTDQPTVASLSAWAPDVEILRSYQQHLSALVTGSIRGTHGHSPRRRNESERFIMHELSG